MPIPSDRSGRFFLHGIAVLAVVVGSGAVEARLLPRATARVVAIEYVRPPRVPSDAELVATGARIGAIHFAPRQLFDINNGDEDTSLGRVANRLHIRTRQATLRDQLLFKEGERYRPRLLQESARILRSTRYLRDAQIRPVAYQNGLVDIEVVTQDVWTLNPGVSFGRKGGANTLGFEVEELNFLGLGTQLGVGYKSGIDRDSKLAFYRDRQLGSSWWNLSAQFSDNSDGRRGVFSLERPFFALDTRWAAGLLLNDDRRIDSRYDLGKIVDQFATRERQLAAYVGRSAGLRNDWVTRWKLGATLDQASFALAARVLPSPQLPAKRDLLYPWAEAEWLQDEFRTERNRDQIEKTEDVALGWRARLQLGYASTALGSDRNAVMLAAAVSKGRALSDRQSLLLDMSAHGRIERGAFSDSLISAESRYYFRQSPRRLFFANLSAQWGRNLDSGRQILLGGDSGLRGYPLRYQAGTGRWLFTAEQRLFTNWYPFQLVNVGGAVFYDMGQTWGRDPFTSRSQRLLKDVGIGLRLGNSRSALGNVLHIDVAFPLDGDSAIKRVQFVVETKRRF